MDRLIANLIVMVIDIYIILMVVRVFLAESERYDAVFGLVFRATDVLLRPFGPALRSSKVDLAPLLMVVLLLLFKGMLLGSIFWALQGFVNRVFQLFVLIILIISTYREYYINPIASFGQRMVHPIRAVAANFSRHIVTINLLSVLLLVVLHTLVTLILQGVVGDATSNPLEIKGVFTGSLRLIVNLTNFFTLVIIAHALLSWVNPDPDNPIVQLIAFITAPIVDPIRRAIPPVGGMLDISPIIAILALQVANVIGHSVINVL